MISELITEYITPARIVAVEGNIFNADTLLKEKEKQISLNEKELCSAQGKGYLVLDFGMEYVGGARILTYSVSAPTTNIRLRFGESLSECYSTIGEKGACNDHALRDFKTMLNSYSDMTFGGTGFRFLRIDFLEETTVTLKNVYCAYTHRQFDGQKAFNSKDSRIREIFATAKRTVELCCQTYIWDGIKRDRLVWIGDMHPEMLALTSMYGRCEIFESSLDFSTTQFPADTWMNRMPMYSVWMLIILADYYAYSPDYVRSKKEYILQSLQRISECVKADGELDFPSYFVDWPTHEQVDEMAGCRALLTVCANKCAELLPLLEEPIEEAKALQKKLSRKSIEVVCAKQVIALKYWATGVLTEEEKNKLIVGNAKGMSTFTSYYVLKAVAETKGVDIAVSMLKEYYGAMLDKGATTFFEDFDMEWVDNTCRLDELPKEGERDIHGDFGKYCYGGFRHSFCHGWSAGIIQFLYENCNE